MYKVGLTGGIGSGKTLICKIFETFGVPVFHADQEAGKLMDEDKSLKDNIIREYGKDLYASGKLDRKKMASIAFHDKNALNKLNSLVHPVVRKKFEQWVTGKAGHKYIIEEAAILLESGSADQFDIIVTVSAPENLRIRRVMKRDGVSEEDIVRRMQNQLNEVERNKLADVVIMNDGTMLVIPQVLKLHHRFLSSGMQQLNL